MAILINHDRAAEDISRPIPAPMRGFIPPLLFALTMFLSAGLLFCVQPMIAKMILPLLGGSPMVWNTCMVFFQSLLLLGYVWAHMVSGWPQPRWQAVVHIGLVLLPLVVLPIGITSRQIEGVPYKDNPIPWLIGVLLFSVGLPFFVLSTTAPLLQKWFAFLGSSRAKDPYYLYGASNLGSLLALLGYPLLLEPRFFLGTQSRIWAAGYGVLAILMVVVGAVVWRRGARVASHSDDAPAPVEGISWLRRLRWLALAFVPSSLMLGVTTYLTTDIAPIPLLWVLPLSIYLLTFILVFSRWSIIPHGLMLRLLPVVALVLTVLLFAEDMKPPLWLLIPLHFLMLFTAAMACHGELARDRPPVVQLTEFYLWLALGGVLGGLFNAIIAPMIFRRVLEYPLAVILACLLRPPPVPLKQGPFVRLRDWTLPLALGIATCVLVLISPRAGIKSAQISVGLMAGIPAMICYLFVDRPLRFALGMAAIMVAGFFYAGGQGELLHIERNFFGVIRVTQDKTGEYRQLVHGSTIHGRQSLDPARSHEPLAYFYASGPIGRVFKFFNPDHPTARIGVIGLGAGSLAAYAQPDQEWTFYEIDPAVERVAKDYFTFLNDCKAGIPKIVLGDARLRLREAQDGYYDMIVLDAFSSDVVPVHLLTREAMALYLSKLKPDGFLCFHCSSRYLDLKPIIANVARDAGLTCLAREDLNTSLQEKQAGKEPSQWMVMARPGENIERLRKSGLWEPMQGQAGVPVWTDDYSNILEVFKWELPERAD
jgi:hypothetical protein